MPGPWDVLTETDLRVTHLMVQRRGDKEMLHAFMSAADGINNWSWREVPIVVGGTGDVGAFEFLAPGGSFSRRRSRAGGAVWARARGELDLAFKNMESYDENENKRGSLDR